MYIFRFVNVLSIYGIYLLNFSRIRIRIYLNRKIYYKCKDNYMCRSIAPNMHMAIFIYKLCIHKYTRSLCILEFIINYNISIFECKFQYTIIYFFI